MSRPARRRGRARDLLRLAGAMRPPFLVLTPACVLLGTASAVYGGAAAEPALVALALGGALAAHVSVNAFNEYFDFASGLDACTVRTPFSGGSGTLPRQPQLAGAVLALAVAALFVAAAVGLYCVMLRGGALLPLGLLGLAIVVGYTPWITRRVGWSLVAPGLGFGPLIVLGSEFVLSGGYSRAALAASLVPFFLVNNLLLLNQFPDVAADRSVGRRNLPIAAGLRRSAGVYGLFAAAAGLAVLAGVWAGWLPRAALLALGGVALAVPVTVGAWRHGRDTPRLVPYLGLNVAAAIVTPLLLALGLLLG